MPSGIYHRFSLDKNEYMKVLRLFKVSRLPARFGGDKTLTGMTG